MSHLLKRSLLQLLAITLMLSALPAWAQRGAMTVPGNLNQLTKRAGIIARGTVMSVKVEKHPEFSGLDTVVVTMQVKETLKGQAGKNLTFRQYVWDLRDTWDAAGYKKGQDLLLMLLTPNQYGLTSPAGMQQGRFLIMRDKTGKEFAVNGQSNFKLFDGMSAQLAKKGVTLSPKYSTLISRHRVGPLETADLTGLIRELAKRGR